MHWHKRVFDKTDPAELQQFATGFVHSIEKAFQKAGASGKSEVYVHRASEGSLVYYLSPSTFAMVEADPEIRAKLEPCEKPDVDALERIEF